MRVSEVMTRDVDTARPGDSIQKVAKMMADGDYGVVPVVENDRLEGIVTDRDIAVRAVAAGKSADAPVSEIMSGSLKTVREDDDVDEVYDTMAAAQVRRLPVVDGEGRLCGIVAMADVARRDDDKAVGDTLQEVSEKS